MKRRVLFAVDRPFLPPSDGSSHIYMEWLRFLQDDGHEVFLLSFNGREPLWDSVALARVKDLVSGMLILEHYGSVFGFLGKASLIWAGRVFGVHQFYCPTADRLFNRDNRRILSRFLSENRIDVMVFNKVELAAAVGPEVLHRFGGLKIIDTHDMHALHYEQAKQVMASRSWRKYLFGPYRPYLSARLFLARFDKERALAEELWLLSLFNVIAVLSSAEMEFFGQLPVIGERACYIPPFFRPEPVDHFALRCEGRESFDFGFLGSGGIFNVEGLEYLGRVLLPEIRARQPGAFGAVGGGVCRVADRLLGVTPGLTVLGHVNVLKDFYESVRVVVVPLLSGTGVSIKTLEAMSFGRPVVATSAGVRGLDLEAGVEVIVEDDPRAFAEAVVRLNHDARLRKQIGEAGARAVRARYSLAGNVEKLRALLAYEVSTPSPSAKVVSV